MACSPGKRAAGHLCSSPYVGQESVLWACHAIRLSRADKERACRLLCPCWSCPYSRSRMPMCFHATWRNCTFFLINWSVSLAWCNFHRLPSSCLCQLTALSDWSTTSCRGHCLSGTDGTRDSPWPNEGKAWEKGDITNATFLTYFYLQNHQRRSVSVILFPGGTSGDAEKGREVWGEGNESGRREQYLAKPWTVNYVILFLSAVDTYIIKRGLSLPRVTQCWWLCWAKQRQIWLQQIECWWNFSLLASLSCVARGGGQTSYSAIHQSLHYNVIGSLFIHLVSHHLRLTVCRATAPAAGEPILNKTVSVPSGTLQGVQCHGAHHEGIKSVHHVSAYYSYDFSDELCLKLVCYPLTEADSCPSAPLALKAVCWQSEMCASSQRSMSEDLHMYTSPLYLLLLTFPEAENSMVLWSVGPCLPEIVLYSREAGISQSVAVR